MSLIWTDAPQILRPAFLSRGYRPAGNRTKDAPGAPRPAYRPPLWLWYSVLVLLGLASAWALVKAVRMAIAVNFP